MKQAITLWEKLVRPQKIAYAHCDLPCGVYDPTEARIAAQTAYNATKKLLDLDATGLERENTVGRMVAVKEEHAQKCKEHLWVLWSDYFKPEDVEAHPQLHDIIWKATKLCTTVKRGVDLDAAQQLLDAVDTVDEIFWSTPGAPAAAVVKK